MPTNYSDTPDSDTVEAPLLRHHHPGSTATPHHGANPGNRRSHRPRPCTPAHQTPAAPQPSLPDKQCMDSNSATPTDIGTAEIPGRGGTSKRAQPTPLRPLQDPQPQRKHQPHFGIGQ